MPYPMFGAFFKKNRTVVAAALFLSLIVLYGLAKAVTGMPAIAQDVILGLVAAMGMHLLDRVWLHRDTEEQFKDIRGEIILGVIPLAERMEKTVQETANNIEADIKNELQKAIEDIPRGAKSLESMRKTGASQLYANRQEAANDIFHELSNRNCKKIRIIGVSLSDFVRNTGKLKNAWQLIVDHINSDGHYYGADIDIKLLIIDPRCREAMLRSRGEMRGDHRYDAGDLETDVNAHIDLLLGLQARARQKHVSFEARIYRLAPILFLCQNERISFTQQYYFWSERADIDEAAFPVIRFDNAPDGTKCVHSELESHFDWIWSKASIDLVSYKDGHCRGVDRGICSSGISNIYTNPRHGRERITHLLRRAERQVRMQGISLHSFVAVAELSGPLRRLLDSEKIDVGMYFLNPLCEQAKFRAFREESFDRPVDRDEYFASDALHRSSTLFRDTMDARVKLAAMLREISKQKKNWNPDQHLHFAYYQTAPSCFLLQVDDTILVEQYHYGKLPHDMHGERIILGKDLPLVEYRKDPSDLYRDVTTSPFSLLDSHLDFVAEQSELFRSDWWKALVAGS